MSSSGWDCFMDMGKLRKFVEENKDLPDSMPIFLEQDCISKFQPNEGNKLLSFEPGDEDKDVKYSRAWDIRVHHEDKDIIVINVNY